MKQLGVITADDEKLTTILCMSVCMYTKCNITGCLTKPISTLWLSTHALPAVTAAVLE